MIGSQEAQVVGLGGWTVNRLYDLGQATALLGPQLPFLRPKRGWTRAWFSKCAPSSISSINITWEFVEVQITRLHDTF